VKTRSWAARAPGAGRLPGLVLAAGTALISGVSVFVNSYAVRAVPDAEVYTTAKNLVAAAVLLLAVTLWRAPWGARPRLAPPPPETRRGIWGRRLGLAYVGVVGGGVAFLMFFSGLAQSSAQPAAFLHDTLVVWVALLAWPFLRERVSGWNLLAIGLLVVGEVALAGGTGQLSMGGGAGLVLGATLLWAVETVVAKRLLVSVSPGRVAVTRMGVGVGVLVAYLGVTGSWGAFLTLGPRQWSWALLTGLLLAAYVGTWMGALARSRALDVTSLLVGSVLVTTVLSAAAGAGGLAAESTGLVLVALGVVLIARVWPRSMVARPR
jgi:drug/metabolite transporter (DMT)-like permease